MKKILVRIKTWNHDPEFELVNAYNVDKEDGICIAKFPDSKMQYAITDIATGCSAGRRCKTLTEAKEYLESTFLLYRMQELEEARKGSYYKQLVRQKKETKRLNEEIL